MFSLVKKITVFVLPAMISFQLQAQQKQLSDDQYFKGNLKGIIQPTANVTRWIDNSNFLLNKSGKILVVNAATGEEKESTDADLKANLPPVKPRINTKLNDLYYKFNDAESQLTNDSAKEINATLRRDGKFVA